MTGAKNVDILFLKIIYVYLKKSLGLHNGEVLQHPATDCDPRGADGCGHVAAGAPALLHQVSCDWRRAGHVTTVLTADWSVSRTSPPPTRWPPTSPPWPRTTRCSPPTSGGGTTTESW